MSDPRTIQPVAPPQPVTPTAEYVVGGRRLWSRGATTLPWAFDDVTADFGDDIYEKMLLDPQVRACLNVLRSTVIADGVTLSSAIADEEQDGYDLADEIRAFCDSAIADMETPLDDALWDMLAALAFGSRIAEEVYRQEGSFLTLHALKVKPRKAAAFVVDPFLNVVGIAAQLPGMGWGGSVTTDDLSRVPSILPRSKFAILTFRPENSDPRGTSLLRPAYSFWWMKQQIPAEWLKFLSAHAVPTIIGKTRGGQVQQSDGTTIDRTTAMLNTLVALKNNSAAVIGLDDEVTPLTIPEGASQFVESIDACDRQITTGILGQTLATMEGKHQTRAASQEHGTVLDEAINQIRRSVCGMLRRDVLRPLVEVNYGPQAAAALTPRPSLGAAETTDMGALMAGIASLASANYLDASQYTGIDAMLGLPPRAVADTTQETTPNEPV